VIRIRYSSELQPGLNGKAVRVGGTTFVYLLPGLTPAQRAATLRRLRQHGRMGLSPGLPAAPLLAAVLQDRIRTAFGQARAIVRIHPAGSTVPVIIISAGVIGFLLVAAVSVKIVHSPLATGASQLGAPSVSGPMPAAGATPAHGGLAPGSPATRPPSPNAPGSPNGPGSPSGPGSPTGSTGNSGTVPVDPSPTTSVGIPLTSIAATSPPSIQPTAPVSTAPGPSASTTTGSSPSARPSPGSGPPTVFGTTVCIKLGPFGICV
jgi:hypothetical protein